MGSKNYFSLSWLIYIGVFFPVLVYAGVENRPLDTDDAYILDIKDVTEKKSLAVGR
jgi:hypothetical protein